MLSFSKRIVNGLETFTTFVSTDIDWTQQSYIFKIFSGNKHGLSKEFSIIKIPHESNNKFSAYDLKTLIRNATSYSFTWNVPDGENLSTFLVYCAIEMSDSVDTPFTCLNSLNVLNRTSIKEFEIIDNRPLAFGIITQTPDNFSSGITWSSCAANIDSNSHSYILIQLYDCKDLWTRYILEIGGPKSLWIHKIGTTFFEIKWSLSCLDYAVAQSYNFCLILLNNGECKNISKNTNEIKDSTMNFGGLEPFREYQIKMQIVSLHAIGNWSSFADVKTHISSKI